MLEKIKTRVYEEVPYILIGDLSAPVNDPAVSSLLESSLLKDHG